MNDNEGIMRQMIADLKAERDELKDWKAGYRSAFEEKLAELRKENDALRTELERIRELNIKDTNSVLWKIADVQKERDALRAKLEKAKRLIKIISDDGYLHYSEEVGYRYKEIIKQAKETWQELESER